VRKIILNILLGDKILPICFDVTPTISYDYLFLENGSKYSFHNNELNKSSSEKYPNKRYFN
jgi:hypothetical protein